MTKTLGGALAAAVICASLTLAAPIAQARVHHHHHPAAAAASHRRRHHAAHHAHGHVPAHGRHRPHGHPAFASHRRHAALCQRVMVRRHWVERCRG